MGSIHQTINAVTGGLTMFGAIALLAAAFGIINTLYMSVRDRTREIGLMKAWGSAAARFLPHSALRPP
nr:ABC transporter permease [Lacticaseibacillus camelliae]